MPRKVRIDAPGALHHVIVRGIAWRKIFNDDNDRDFFVERLGKIFSRIWDQASIVPGGDFDRRQLKLRICM
jgi:hypothetical protein